MSSRPNHLYEFGPFVLDPAERTLQRGGSPVPLQPKVFDTLLVLVQNGGHLIEKDEFMRAIWPEDEFVEEQNLNKNISKLRRALGNGAGGAEYIETVPKSGYRFAAEVRTVGAVRDAELTVATRTSRSLIAEGETEDESPAAGAGRPAEEAVIAKPAVETTTGAPARRGLIIAAVLLALTLGLLAYVRPWRQTSVAPRAEIKSLAVLPLKSLDAGENFLG